MQTRSLLLRISILLLILEAIAINVAGQTAEHWESVILPGDIWRYIIPSSEPPASWDSLIFDESSWLSGKGGIGYGDNDDSTVLVPPVGSVYMRIKFNVDDVSVIEDAVLHVDYDDGFVAYLNGHEIARANIGTPFVRPAYSDFAASCTEPKVPYGNLPSAFMINRDTIKANLRTGENVLALQVHNCNLGSSDLSSTTFFSILITNNSTYYRPVPSWFNIGLPDISTLPIISINTNGGTIIDGTKIMATARVINNGPGKTNSPTDKGTDYDGPIGIEYRGQSSLMFPKKPYSVEIRKTETIDSTASLLGMPSNKDWVLYAPYSDKPMMRNFITFFLGGKMGSWQPRCRYFVLYMNGEYEGIYILMEHIRRDVNRVDISGLGQQDVAGDDVTGGYIFKADKLGGLNPGDYFTTYPTMMFRNTRNYTFTYVYPKADKIMDAQKSYIKSYIEEAESVLNGPDFTDPVIGIQKYFDYGSFVDFQIMTELSLNVDGYRLSQFFYKKKITHGNKIFCGPLWDIDLGYGNADYYNSWLTDFWLYPNYAPDWEHPMHYWYRLMQDPVYLRHFVTRWRELRRDIFSTGNIMHIIDSVQNYIGPELEKNYQKWPIIGTYVWPNYYVGPTYQDDLDYFRNWLTDRLNWMDTQTSLTSDFYDRSFPDANEIVIYPVPVKDKLTIALNAATGGDIRFEMTTLSGIRVYDVKRNVVTGNQELILDLPELNPGYYVLKISQDNRVIAIKKIIKF